MKHLASYDLPSESGWYLWWDEPEDRAPFHVLARVKVNERGVFVNFVWEKDVNDFTCINEVASRLWLKVSE